MQRSKLIAVPFLILAVLALLAGLWAGLLRLGWELPGMAGPLPLDHGPLMVGGFLGTLIALERVIAIRRAWMFLGPLSSGIGWVVSLAFPGSWAGALLITLGSLVFVAILGVMVRREPRIHTITMGTGALCWLVGDLFWLAGRPIFHLVWWWAAFLVLTVAGERLELSRVMKPTQRQQRLFVLAVGVFLAGVALQSLVFDWGVRLAGAGLLGLALWLARYDLARRNLRHPAPLTRYIAACLFAGYIWLMVSGLTALSLGAQMAGGYYDAMLHAIFLGFVISMIFGHAPIILPALTGIMVRYTPGYYAHLALLHLSLVMRVSGDLLGMGRLRMWGGLLNEVAILLFIAVTAFTQIAGSRAKPAVITPRKVG